MAAISKFIGLLFATLLVKDFENWKAFELGIIDKDGNIIRNPATPEEKRSMGSLEDLVRKIKKVLMKVVPSNKYLQFLLTAYLLKKENNETHFMTNDGSYVNIMGELHSILSEYEYNQMTSFLDEHADKIN